jgi:cytochrome c553
LLRGSADEKPDVDVRGDCRADSGGAFCPLHQARGFRASSTPGAFETSAARLVRDFAIPRAAKARRIRSRATTGSRPGRDEFLSRCATCHGSDGRGATPIGSTPVSARSRSARADDAGLTDGEIRYIIANGIQLTGMPAMPALNGQEEQVSWALVTLPSAACAQRRPLRPHVSNRSRTPRSTVGSTACERCHSSIYARWKSTPMANVVRDPREHPDAITPDLKTNNVAPFHRRPGRLRLRQQMEAALLHAHRRRLLSAAGSVGHRQQDVATVPRRRHWRGLVDCLLSLGQSSASDRANVRWLSLRQLRHRGQEAV